MYAEAYLRELFEHNARKALNLKRVCDADGITEVNGGDAGFARLFKIRDDLLRRDDAVERAAEGGCCVKDDLHVGIALADRAEIGKGLVRGAADVRHVVTRGDGDDIADLTEAGVPCVLDTSGVRGERIERNVGIGLEHVLGYLRGIRHLGDGLGVYEGRGLYLLAAGRDEHVDDLFLCLGGDEFLHALEAVSWADLDELYAFRIFRHYSYLPKIR